MKLLSMDKVKRQKLQGIYHGMKQRCSNPNAPAYKWYGQKGIKVCDRWSTFQNFYEDMHKKYKPGLSIDRIDPKGDYEPGNCRWLSRSENTSRRYPMPKITIRSMLAPTFVKQAKKRKVTQEQYFDALMRMAKDYQIQLDKYL